MIFNVLFANLINIDKYITNRELQVLLSFQKVSTFQEILSF